jgi:GNAT superfamily N-acetyltransferase
MSTPPMPGDLPKIRAATRADLPRIVELLQQLSLDDPREDPGPPLPAAYLEAFDAIQQDPRQQHLVLEIDGQVLGTLVLIVLPSLSHHARSYAILEDVVVDGTARSRGYGELLVRHAIELARQAGCYRVGLTSNQRRLDAHRFYERLGFQPTHQGFKLEF